MFLPISLVTIALITLVRGAIYTRFEDIPQRLPFDFVIIGGGTAGNALANRLTENPQFNVLVLEAGPSNEGIIDSIVPFFADQVVPFTRWDWNYTTVPQKELNDRSIIYPRGHLLGGSSSVNYMTYTRGSSEDWDRYASISGDNEWSWSAVQTYFRKNEKWTQPADNHNTTGQFNPAVHSTTGINGVSLPGFPQRPIDSRVIQTTQNLSEEFPFNEDMNSGFQLGIGWMQSTISGGKRSSSATSYLGPRFISRKNLNVLVNARVTRVFKTGTSHDDKPEILGVEFVNAENNHKKYSVSAQKELILSAGSVNTPQLLQLSGIGDRRLLSSLKIPVLVDSPSVGRNLSDHPLVNNLWLARVNASDTFQGPQRNGTLADEQFKEWNTTKTGPLVDSFANHLAWLRVPSTETDFWAKFKDPAAGKNTAHFELLFCNGFIPGSLSLPPTGAFFSILTAVVSPASRGSVMLNTSDPFAAPLIDLGFFTSDIDFEILKLGVRSAQQFLTGPAWKDYIIEPVNGLDNTTTGTDAELEEYIRANAGSTFHATGTSSISPVGAKWGVVDPDLRVKGVSGLRIVDLSVLPVVPAAHPHVPAYIVGERAGDLIKQAWSSTHP